MTHGFLNKVWSPGGGDGGNPEDDQAVNEDFPDLRNLPVNGQHAGRGGGAPPPGQSRGPSPGKSAPQNPRRRR